MDDFHQFSDNDIKKVLFAFRDALTAHCDVLNALNVYPVPDGDTGTNMSLTLISVTEELEKESAKKGVSQWKAISHGSLMGARGNSGVILSQILRSLSDSFSVAEEIDMKAVSEALSAASEAAYGSVMKPVEGTILTVAREVAELATEIAKEDMSMVSFLEKIVEEGKASLERTPELLPVLKEAGVVDAGGAGYLLLLSSFLHVADNRPIPAPAEVPTDLNVQDNMANIGLTEVGELRYEVMFFLEAADKNIDKFKEEWATLGDSIVVVGGDSLYNCHIHTDDIGGAIEAGIKQGKPNTIRVTDLHEELGNHEESIEIGGESSITITDDKESVTAVVAVVVGKGIHAIFDSLGVHAVVRGGQSMNPSVRDLVQAVESISADHVIILPNNKNIIPVSEQVDSQVEKRVAVIPTRSIPEGFASLLAFDPRADAESNVEPMTAAAGQVLPGEITRAVRDSETSAGKVKEGDWIGLDRNGVCVIADSVSEASIGLLDGLIGSDHELVTVIAGEGSNDDSTIGISEWLQDKKPHVEVEIHDGGQPLYPYYFGVE